MSWQKGDLVYEGKAKRLYKVVSHPELVWMEFKDSLTAFNGVKSGSFEGKGQINKRISELAFAALKTNGIGTHLREVVAPNAWLTEKVQILPLEVIVRNRVAGSFAKRFLMDEGAILERPLVEFFYKKDEWNDPFINDEHALFLKAAENQAELEEVKARARQINAVLKKLFFKAGFDLVDFKIEFGKTATDQILLADEISPDSCRIWDSKTQEKFDKDRFRRDLGNVESSYREVLQRLEKVEV
jgi:phosphoribosylaminoimidazole-succinocarboxamide synthase